MTATLQKSLEALRGFTRKEQRPRCELCALDIGEDHQHLLEPATRQVICGCTACCLLFDDGGRTRYRRIPRDASALVDFKLSDPEWDRLSIPISLGFIYRSSAAGAIMACYPSPLGIVEATLDDDLWPVIVAANPALGEMRDDVQALLVNRLRGRREYFLAPIDRCFELNGIVRRYWKGLNGGDEVHVELDRYFAALRQGARR